MRQYRSDLVLKMAKPDKRAEAVVLLARNISQTRVAQMVGVDRRTVVRWLKDSDFRKKLDENRRDHLENTLHQVIDNSAISAQNTEEISQIDSLVAKAIAALDSIISCPESRNADRIRASELIFKLVGNRVQAFSGGNSGGKPSRIPAGDSVDRSVEIDRLLQRRELLKSRMAALENQ
jgi:transcriptional regulator with XRE-family HTH domain